jgi:hypothetical protein
MSWWQAIPAQESSMLASLPQLMREEAFKSKPRGRVMVYRDWLCDLCPQVKSYIHTISHKRRREMRPQMIALYELAQKIGTADFVAALELAAEQQMYGVEVTVRRLVKEGRQEKEARFPSFRSGYAIKVAKLAPPLSRKLPHQAIRRLTRRALTGTL